MNGRWDAPTTVQSSSYQSPTPVSFQNRRTHPKTMRVPKAVSDEDSKPRHDFQRQGVQTQSRAIRVSCVCDFVDAEAQSGGQGQCVPRMNVTGV